MFGINANTCAGEVFGMISSLEQVGTEEAIGTPAYIRLQETVAAIAADEVNHVISKAGRAC